MRIYLCRIPQRPRAQFLYKMAESTNSVLTYKVVFAGRYGVGKTSLFRRIFDMGFDDNKPSGIGSKLYSKTFAEDKIVVRVRPQLTVEYTKYIILFITTKNEVELPNCFLL